MKEAASRLDLLRRFDCLPDDRLSLKSLALFGTLCRLMRLREARSPNAVPDSYSV
ncbi:MULTISPECIES: hypothetical protein [unclassified Microcoleus]|uniref:hypothetical protein n=1 Tax=unclassified Microcoleus TaxID=2642155 RepID=UPI002FD579EC